MVWVGELGRITYVYIHTYIHTYPRPPSATDTPMLLSSTWLRLHTIKSCACAQATPKTKSKSRSSFWYFPQHIIYQGTGLARESLHSCQDTDALSTLTRAQTLSPLLLGHRRLRHSTLLTSICMYMCICMFIYIHTHIYYTCGAATAAA